MNSDSLYQEVILDHNKKPRNWGKISDAEFLAEGLNPLCGDHIWVSLNLLEKKVAEIGFEGESCAICKASASMMTSAVKGKKISDIESMIEHFRKMVLGSGSDDVSQKLGRLVVFSGIKNLPSRVTCCPIFLCLDACSWNSHTGTAFCPQFHMS